MNIPQTMSLQTLYNRFRFTFRKLYSSPSCNWRSFYNIADHLIWRRKKQKGPEALEYIGQLTSTNETSIQQSKTYECNKDAVAVTTYAKFSSALPWSQLLLSYAPVLLMSSWHDRKSFENKHKQVNLMNGAGGHKLVVFSVVICILLQK